MRLINPYLDCSSLIYTVISRTSRILAFHQKYIYITIVIRVLLLNSLFVKIVRSNFFYPR